LNSRSTLFDAKLASCQGAQLAEMVRWVTPTERLAMATSRNQYLDVGIDNHGPSRRRPRCP
jgi:hypothetical protein